MSTTDNPSSAIERHAWLAKLSPKSIVQQITDGDPNPLLWAYNLSHISPAQFLAALLDPELKALHVSGVTCELPKDGSLPAEIPEELEPFVYEHMHFHSTRRLWAEPRVIDHVFIRQYGGQGAAMRWHGDELVVQSIPKLKSSYPDQWEHYWDDVKCKWGKRSAVDHWLQHPKTKRYASAEWKPGLTLDADSSVFNLWRGWAFTQADEEARNAFTVEDIPRACRRFVEEHIYDVMCDQNDEHFWFLMLWLAHAFHRPWENTTTALALIGPMGSGKDFFAEAIGQLFAPYTLTLDKPDQLTGKFNAHLQRALWVTAAESFFAGRAQADTLKALITQERIMVEPKGFDAFMAAKSFRLCMTSNRLGSLHIEQGDRRYFVLEVDGNRGSKARNKNADYHGALRDEWRNGGAQAFFDWMRSYAWKCELLDNKDKLHLRPTTAALQEQRLLSLSKVDMAVHNMLLTGQLPCKEQIHNGDGLPFIPTMAMHAAARLGDRDVTSFGRALAAAGGRGAREVHEGTRWSGYWMPKLSDARAAWAAHLGQPVTWPDECLWATEAEPPAIPF